MKTQNYYEILEIGEKVSEEEIKKAYYRLAKKYHPDVSPETEKRFKEILEAYQILIDPKGRAKYDLSLRLYPKKELVPFERANFLQHISVSEIEEFIMRTKKGSILIMGHIDDAILGLIIEYLLHPNSSLSFIKERVLFIEGNSKEEIWEGIKNAERGETVFLHLPASSIIHSLNIAIDSFSIDRSLEIYKRFALFLQAGFSYCLLDSTRKVMAVEIMVVNPAIASLIKEGRPESLPLYIQMGKEKKMQTMNKSLADLYNKGLITYTQAINASPDKDELIKIIGDGNNRIEIQNFKDNLVGFWYNKVKEGSIKLAHFLL